MLELTVMAANGHQSNLTALNEVKEETEHIFNEL